MTRKNIFFIMFFVHGFTYDSNKKKIRNSKKKQKNEEEKLPG